MFVLGYTLYAIRYFSEKNLLFLQGLIFIFELSDDQIENRTKFLEYHLKQLYFLVSLLNRGKSVFEYRNLFKKKIENGIVLFFF